jgi:hypothetical protein
MQSNTFRSVIALALLLGGLLIVYTSSWSDLASDPARDGFTYVTDVDYWQRTKRERLVETTFPFDLAHDLNEVPLELGDWQGEDVPETNQETFILLEPEQFVRRVYENSTGKYLWLTLIGSRQSRSFHPPDLCYDADGWQTSLSLQAVTLSEGGGMYGLWLEAQKQFNGDASAVEAMTFYFYLFPNRERDQADGIVIFRITSPRYGTIEETIALQGSFLRQLFNSATPVEGAS